MASESNMVEIRYYALTSAAILTQFALAAAVVFCASTEWPASHATKGVQSMLVERKISAIRGTLLSSIPTVPPDLKRSGISEGQNARD